MSARRAYQAVALMIATLLSVVASLVFVAALPAGASTPVAPTITSASSASVVQGKTFKVKASGKPKPTFSATGLPSGVTIASTGVITVSTGAAVGVHTPFTISAANSAGTATQHFTLTVTADPVITSAATAHFTTVFNNTFQFTATGYPAPTFALSSGTLPTGLTLTSGGLLSGIPAASTIGTYSLKITATNALKTAKQTFSLTIAAPANNAPHITSAAATTFTTGTSGTFTVTATGYPVPTFSKTGTLPSGVTLNSTTGVLSGTPAAGTGGSYSIVITAANGISPNATQNFTLTVDQAPAITSAASTAFNAGTAGSFTVTDTGYPAPTVTESGTLPSGVTFSGGVLSGTPGAAAGGSYPITITASNGVGSNATQDFTLTVDQAPAITSAASTTFNTGAAGTFTVTTT
ncbi:MAG: putative Ig domain-containing protein, partial [Acidimicrobiales bacterium]